MHFVISPSCSLRPGTICWSVGRTSRVNGWRKEEGWAQPQLHGQRMFILYMFSSTREQYYMESLLSTVQCQSLVDDLKHTQLYNSCAHGRPTTVPLVNFQASQAAFARPWCSSCRDRAPLVGALCLPWLCTSWQVTCLLYLQKRHSCIPNNHIYDPAVAEAGTEATSQQQIVKQPRGHGYSS